MTDEHSRWFRLGEEPRDHIAVPSAASLLDVSGPGRAIAARFNCRKGSKFLQFFSSRSAFNESAHLRLNSDGLVDVNFRAPAAQVSMNSGATRYDEGKWHNALLVEEGAGDWKLYVDEVEVASPRPGGERRVTEAAKGQSSLVEKAWCLVGQTTPDEKGGPTSW